MKRRSFHAHTFTMCTSPSTMFTQNIKRISCVEGEQLSLPCIHSIQCESNENEEFNSFFFPFSAFFF